MMYTSTNPFCKDIQNTSSYAHEPVHMRLFFSTLHHDAFSTNKRLLLRSPSSFSANESSLTRLALELRGVWRSFFIVSEVVWSHHSRVQCPTNWFPFLTSEVGAVGWGRWLHINRVFPRRQTNLSLYLLHSHYRQLGWHMQGCISLLSLSKQTGTHLPIHTGVCTQYTHTHTHTSPLEWPPEDWEGIDFLHHTHPHIDLQITLVRIRSFRCWPKFLPRRLSGVFLAQADKNKPVDLSIIGCVCMYSDTC